MIKKITLCLVVSILAGCASNQVMVRSLDATIIDAAQKAQFAGAKEISVEVSVISGYKGTASVPISVVTVGGEKSVSNSTKVTAKVDLNNWSDPTQKMNALDSKEEDYYLLDIKTLELKSLSYTKAQFYRAKCYSENKELGNWSSDKTVAENSKSHHERNNPDHSVSIISK